MQTGRMSRFEIDLNDKKRVDEEFADINFDSLYIENLTGQASIKFDSVRNRSYDLNSIVKFENLGNIEKFYITHEKQKDAKLEIIVTKNLDLITSGLNSMRVIESVGLKTSDVNFDEENDDLIVKPRNSKIENADNVTPSDSDIIDLTSGLYIGSMGDLRVRLKNGNTVTFKELSSGVIHPIRCDMIYQSGTTAQDILALY